MSHPPAKLQISPRPTSPRFVGRFLGKPLVVCFAGYMTVGDLVPVSVAIAVRDYLAVLL